MTAKGWTARLDLYDHTGRLLEYDAEGLILKGSEIDYSTADCLCATARLQIARTLPWSRLVAAVTAISPTGTATAMGRYLLATPKRPDRAGAIANTVHGYEVLSYADDRIGATRVADSATPATTIAARLLDRDNTLHLPTTGIVPSAATLPASVTWPITDRTTWLAAATEVLDAVGYAHPHTDRHGQIVAAAYTNPRDQAVHTHIHQHDTISAVLEEETWGRPNVWVGIADNPEADIPTLGAGIHRIVNQSDGPASIDAVGRERPRTQEFQAVSQQALAAATQAMADEDRRQERRVLVEIEPNPTFWRNSLVAYHAPRLGFFDTPLLVHQWAFPLDGSPTRLVLQ